MSEHQPVLRTTKSGEVEVCAECGEHWPCRSEHIKRLVDAAPPLTAEQKAKLVVLFRPSPSRSAKA